MYFSPLCLFAIYTVIYSLVFLPSVFNLFQFAYYPPNASCLLRLINARLPIFHILVLHLFDALLYIVSSYNWLLFSSLRFSIYLIFYCNIYFVMLRLKLTYFQQIKSTLQPLSFQNWFVCGCRNMIFVLFCEINHFIMVYFRNVPFYCSNCIIPWNVFCDRAILKKRNSLQHII